MPEYSLSSGPSTVENVYSAHEENAGNINFDVPDKNMFFKKQNNNFHGPFEMTANALHPANIVFDTAAGQNMIRTLFLPPACRQKMKLVTGICYTTAANDHITVCDVILLFIWLRLPVRFSVVDNLTVPILIRTSYIDWFMNGIIPR